jgi:natural product biosynthesis luciferase-like monooxygenase protein
MMARTVEDLLGVPAAAQRPPAAARAMRFSFLFFSDVRKDKSDAEKYRFMRELALFADRAGFEAVYLPERHFHEFGSIHANPAIVAAHLIAQTTRVRFRTAGVSLPLHHPAEVVEWWAMNDVLSGGRVDLGFGSGWARDDFVFAPEGYEARRRLCSEAIPVVQKLWRGESVSFPGPGGEPVPVRVFPRPVQRELNVWLLVAQNDEGFEHAGRQGYNVFTMLYGNTLEVMREKVRRYREGRRAAGLDPAGGTVTLMLHTLMLDDARRVRAAVEAPFRAYIASSLDAHMKAREQQGGGAAPQGAEREKMLDYAFSRYYDAAAIFGSVEEGARVVDRAIDAGIDEIACLADFGVPYETVMESLPSLERLARGYRASAAVPAGSTSSSAK